LFFSVNVHTSELHGKVTVAMVLSLFFSVNVHISALHVNITESVVLYTTACFSLILYKKNPGLQNPLCVSL
jgi:EAL domain-containing protein (putative c-di-GMP-specific phosphodiesterase class I)